MVSDYEKEKARNIERNAAILRSLGLHQPLFEPLEQKPKATKPLKKRRASIDIEESHPVAKVARVETPVSGGVRRSARTSGKKVDYTAEQQRSSPLPITVEAKPPQANVSQVRLYDPKTFGSIPGVEVGSWWGTRMECSRDSIHAPTVAGISGGPEGAYSVALSGGYEDDVDLGYAFTYTGSGGRDLKGTKAAPKNLRTAPQSFDQNFDNPFNRALKRSCETGKPIRVVRGFKLRSKYAPSEGYRYDGLYKVEKAWIEQGLNPGKYLVCKFAFKRLLDQPPLPVRAIEGDGETEGTDENELENEQAEINDSVANAPGEDQVTKQGQDAAEVADANEGEAAGFLEA